MWGGRLFLSAVRRPGGPPALIPVECVSPASAEAAFRVRLQLPAGVRLADRTLYDVVYKNPRTGRTYTLAPHAVYAKASWERFGFAHATDLHLSKRLDTFRDRLAAAGKQQSARMFNNFNDNFRDFVVYANHLHDIGELDAILLTGDVVDYQFEAGDARAAGGNLAFFVRLVCGRSNYDRVPTFAPGGAEELRVPIFATLGNHDYRPDPYGLRFRVEVAGFDRPKDLYANMNLTRGDALALVGGQTPAVGAADAARMVAIDRDLAFCREHVLPGGTYAVELGGRPPVLE